MRIQGKREVGENQGHHWESVEDKMEEGRGLLAKTKDYKFDSMKSF